MDAYSAFINHFLQARAAVMSATLSRPLFARFMEVLNYLLMYICINLYTIFACKPSLAENNHTNLP